MALGPIHILLATLLGVFYKYWSPSRLILPARLQLQQYPPPIPKDLQILSPDAIFFISSLSFCYLTSAIFVLYRDFNLMRWLVWLICLFRQILLVRRDLNLMIYPIPVFLIEPEIAFPIPTWAFFLIEPSIQVILIPFIAFSFRFLIFCPFLFLNVMDKTVLHYTIIYSISLSVW